MASSRDYEGFNPKVSSSKKSLDDDDGVDSSSSTSLKKKLKKIDRSANNTIRQKLVCNTIQSMKKDEKVIPFHIPHKKVLEKIVHRKHHPEPLANLKDAQEYLTNFVQTETLSSSSGIGDEDTGLSNIEDNEEYLPHNKLDNIINQREWIYKLRTSQDGYLLYMTYAVTKSSEFYTPYALTAVPYDKVDKNNYFTLTRDGVMHHLGKIFIFTTLDKWECEYETYCKIMRFRTFSRFRLWKGFYVWKRCIAFRKFISARNHINENCFILNKELRKGLLAIQDLCTDISELSFINSDHLEGYELFYFIELQMEKLEIVLAQLNKFRMAVIENVSNSCNAALLAKGFVANELVLGEPQPRERKKTKVKTSTYIEQANKKSFCQRLTCFIIVVDYIMMHMNHNVIRTSVEELRDILEKHAKFTPSKELIDSFETNELISRQIELPREGAVPRSPLFNVNVVISDDQLVLDPPGEILIQIWNQLIDLWEEKCDDIPTLIMDKNFRIFTNPVINGKVEERICGYGPKLEYFLKIDEFRKQIRLQIDEILQNNWQNAVDFISNFTHIKQFYFEDINTEDCTLRDNEDLEIFRTMCKRYLLEIDIVKNIQETQPFGLMLLKLTDFKHSVLPESQNLYYSLEQIIPSIGRSKVDNLLGVVDLMANTLEKPPQKTIEYVDYLVYLEKANDAVNDMENILDYCKEIYDIVEEFNLPVTPDEISNYMSVSVNMASLRNLVDKKIEETGMILKGLNDQINKDISILISDIGKIKDLCSQAWLYDIESNVGEVTDFLNDLYQKLLGYQQSANTFKNYQKQFRLEVTRFDILDEVMSDVKLRILLWESVTNWASTIHDWHTCEFNTLNIEDMNQYIAKNVKNISLLEKGLPKNLIVPKFKDDVELMRSKLPVISYMRNPSLKHRHWMKIENILNHKFKPDEIMTLQMFEDLMAFKFNNELMDISGVASSEAGLEALLKKVEEQWKTLEFPVLQHKDAKDVFILGSLEEVQTVLDDSFININTILSSRNVGPIKSRVEEWAKNLDLFSTTLDEWMNCQQNWIYLEVIFSAPDIQRQLPNESKLFIIVDKSWKTVMRRTAKMPLAFESVLYPGLLEIFQKNNALLEQIMKCLESYLEVKRVTFPRFYFLSNDELLEILAQTRNPHAVQPHLRKCFDAIAKLEFGTKSSDEAIHEHSEVSKSKTDIHLSTNIVAMISPEGEKVNLGKGLKARGNVEDWLGKVENSMFITLRRIMKSSLGDYVKSKRTDWVLKHPNQVVLTVTQIMWAKGVHEIFNANADIGAKLKAYEKKCIGDLNNLAGLVRGDLSSVERKIVIALITIDVHARDTINNLVENKVHDCFNFEWLKVLRYYWDENIDDCQARMSSAKYIYGYEYLGASGVLVLTPLTDRCYLCLMGALQLDLGGAPAGPAGTGKTETTKDLAKALAIQCVVFNCSEGLDYKMMGRFFSGLAQSGAWCCFDEFNRIDIEVLSVIAQQLITIRNAKAAKLQRFMFEGREIKLVQKCAAFITMNPGYAGRTELPDNLKALFRPISMMVPDYALIAEVILYSEGFESSKVLSQKMVQMYKLCSEQLSQQDHYDFGMRAVKSVLVMAGSLKRSNPNRNEDVVLICALRDSNLPKFLADDALLFQGILSDLFPGIELPQQDYGTLQTTIVEVMQARNLQPEEAMIKKVIQLYETMIVRWGVMLVGPTGGGKSTVLNTLGYSLTKMYEDGEEGSQFHPVNTFILNPKAVTAGELYGEVNTFTLEWRDGLMGIMMRTAVQSVTEDHQWIICDGPVDAVWIENLNTVLDDNKMLCLANSERIKLTPYVHMVFEVQDLAQASPATVSRCGMVYIDPNELKWLPYVRSWVEEFDEKVLPSDMKCYIVELFVLFIEDGFEFVKKKCHYSIHQVDISKVAMVCAILRSYLSTPKAMENIGEKSKVKTYLCQIFIFAYIWGLGGNLNEYSKEQFELFVQEQVENFADAKLMPGIDLWSNYMCAQTHRMEQWNKILPVFKYDSSTPFFETLVPTIDTVRYGYIMELLLRAGYPVFLVGDTGVGKTVIGKNVLNKLYQTNEYVPVTINFSAQTSSLRTQEVLEIKLEKKKKTLLGAPIGKKIIVFVDDVNMPKLETYGAQPPIELLRQFLTYGGLYDRKKLFWKDIKDVILSAACGPPGGGRNALSPRFVRFFGMLLISQPNEFSLKVIFKAILKGFLDDFSNEVRDLGEYMVNAAIDIYRRISTDLLPTPTKSHYVFNLRDLSKCIQGILQADSGTLRDEGTMLRLFYHECLRVFNDRLINIQDKSYFYRLMKDICSHNFGTPILDLPDTEIIEKPPLLFFGDFMQFGANKEDRIYEEIRNLTKLIDIIQEYLDDYNLFASKNMNLILFMDAIEHSVKIARILRAERGNALLVGVSGMGKQSLTQLASHMNSYFCFRIELTKNYDRVSFFEDLRKVYFKSGAINENNVFLLTDTDIVQEDFLEDINNILNSGDVPNLFETDEYEKVIIAVREKAKEAGISESNRDGIYDYFIQRVRSNLHVVLCMSPVGDAFRRRCRMFPSLVNCCTINWFEKWPNEALMSVAENSLKELGDAELCNNLAKICVIIHESVEEMTERFFYETHRHYYTTPSSYLELIKMYKLILEDKRNKLNIKKDRIMNGLKKIYETNAVIDTMKIALIELEPELSKKSIAVEELMVVLTKESKQADKVRATVKIDEEEAKIKAEATQILADDAQADLNTALPALEAATKALEALNKNDINEIKVFQKPPVLVQFVMESICLLLGAKKTDWATAKIVLSDVNFLKKLKEYDATNISDKTLKKLKVYIDHPDFVAEKIQTVSKACKSMCIWVRAVDMYAKVYRIVEPKRKKLEKAEKELNQVMGLLHEKQRQLAEVERMIQELEQKFNKTVAEQKQLEDDIELTSNRLNRAGRLIVALAGEQSRWEVMVEGFIQDMNHLMGDVLISASFVAYLGAFTSNYRTILVNLWEQVCEEYSISTSKDFSLIHVLADSFHIRMWNSFGLPRDLVSTENAIIVTESRRWALMIDPQEQANRWIRQMEAKNNIIILHLTDANFIRILEGAIRTGRSVLLEEVGESLDPTITPVLMKHIFMQGGRMLIHLGDSNIEYDNNFRFYITTKLSNPHYLPEICIQVTIVNFTVTLSGLEDQLLADVVRLEKPELESQRTSLIMRINEDKMQLDLIEEKILKLLYHSEGNILDDEELIETLNNSKETSAIIAARLIEAETTEQRITEAREKYRIVATRGSVLYFVVAQLAEIDPMYQYSLKYFNQLFNNVIQTSEKNDDVVIRIDILIREITLAVYTNVSRGLFERHKLIYSCMMCVEILKEADKISDMKWDFLLRGPLGSKDDLPPKPHYPIITDYMWKSACFLETNFEEFKGFPRDIVNIIRVDISDFHQDIKLIDTAKTRSKINWNKKLDDFDKLLLLKTLKEEKLVFAITEFVKEHLGRSFIESSQISLQVLYQDMSNIIPLIFILSAGSDPFRSFQRFSEEMSFESKILSISLGQGQGPVAEKLIEEGVEEGKWVFLQNCHLATSWMLNLERLIQRISLQSDKIHADFRLYMSSMPCSQFPVSVLQNSVKVTNEPPKGVRANVRRAFTDMIPEFFEQHHFELDWRTMLFGICMFHAIIQERKKFGPLGWNIVYEFNDSDRDFAFNTLKMFCRKEFIPWDALEYLTGEITYGGRVTDSWDLRCLKTILKIFFSPGTLKLNYAYSKSGVYYAPNFEKLEEYQVFIDAFPLLEEPEIFGMHENANISYQTKETKSILTTIMDCQSSKGGTSEKNSDEVVYNLADMVSDSVILNIDTEEINMNMFKRDDHGRLPSLTTVLIQEIDRYNILLNMIHTSVVNLKKAIKGLVVMSEELEEVYKGFMNNQMPRLWSKKSFNSQKSLGSWIRDLILRLDFISHWKRHSYPVSYWISGFYFPQGFLTGVLQTYARKYNFPIDLLRFDFTVTHTIIQQENYVEFIENAKNIHQLHNQLKNIEDGALVHGIFIDAGTWDLKRMKLIDEKPGELNPLLPTMQMMPMTTMPEHDPRYLAPLYKTPERAGTLSTTGHSTNFVIAVRLATSKQQSYWILKGTALLTQIAD